MDLEEKGLNLRGSVYSCSENKIMFNNDLYSNLKFSDDFAINWSKRVDDFIKQKNMAMPSDNVTKDKRINRSNITSPLEMSFPSSVKSIIWATGFRYNFDWVKLKLTDKNGHPIQKRGVTKYKGFYFGIKGGGCNGFNYEFNLLSNSLSSISIIILYFLKNYFHYL